MVWCASYKSIVNFRTNYKQCSVATSIRNVLLACLYQKLGAFCPDHSCEMEDEALENKSKETYWNVSCIVNCYIKLMIMWRKEKACVTSIYMVSAIIILEWHHQIVSQYYFILCSRQSHCCSEDIQLSFSDLSSLLQIQG